MYQLNPQRAENLNGIFNHNSIITGTTISGNEHTPAQLKSILLNTTDKGFIKIDTLKVRYKSQAWDWNQ